MDDGRLTADWRFAAAYGAGALLLAGYAYWHYLMGHYARILIPAVLTLALVIAALLRLVLTSRPYLSAYIVLIASYLLIAMELPRLEATAGLWASLAPLLTLLLLPLASAMLLNVVMAPVWLSLLGGDQLTGELILGYLAILAIAPLVPWEQRRHQALMLATDPRDPHCNALSSDGLRKHLLSEFQRTELLHQPLAVLMIHLPQLEMASEQFGTRARQTLLDTLCLEVERASRRHDLLGRHDPATFWLVLPNTSENGAQLTKQRILQTIERTVLLDTGPLRTRMALCQRLPGESWPRYERRLLSLSRQFNEH